jgi:MFS family permease
MMLSRKPSLLIIFLTVFIDLIGFGIVLPLLPIFSKDFGASGFMIGLIMASYSMMQFLFAHGGDGFRIASGGGQCCSLARLEQRYRTACSRSHADFRGQLGFGCC